jgi:hypothetical protein
MLGEVLEEAKNVTGAIRGTFFIGTQTLHNWDNGFIRGSLGFQEPQKCASFLSPSRSAERHSHYCGQRPELFDLLSPSFVGSRMTEFSVSSISSRSSGSLRSLKSSSSSPVSVFWQTISSWPTVWRHSYQLHHLHRVHHLYHFLGQSPPAARGKSRISAKSKFSWMNGSLAAESQLAFRSTDIRIESQFWRNRSFYNNFCNFDTTPWHRIDPFPIFHRYSLPSEFKIQNKIFRGFRDGTLRTYNSVSSHNWRRADSQRRRPSSYLTRITSFFSEISHNLILSITIRPDSCPALASILRFVCDVASLLFFAVRGQILPMQSPTIVSCGYFAIFWCSNEIFLFEQNKSNRYLWRAFLKIYLYM